MNSVPSKNPQPPQGVVYKSGPLGFLKIGLFEISFIVCMLVLFFLVLNFFNVLSLSSIFPDQFGWLPHLQKIEKTIDLSSGVPKSAKYVNGNNWTLDAVVASAKDDMIVVGADNQKIPLVKDGHTQCLRKINNTLNTGFCSDIFSPNSVLEVVHVEFEHRADGTNLVTSINLE